MRTWLRLSEPIRTCAGCRRRRGQSELTRITRAGDGTLCIGRTLPGRGAWLCQGSSECLDQAVRQGGFARSFRAQVTPAQAKDLADDFVPGTPTARD